jgi:hypothetical protein
VLKGIEENLNTEEDVKRLVQEKKTEIKNIEKRIAEEEENTRKNELEIKNLSKKLETMENKNCMEWMVS